LNGLNSWISTQGRWAMMTETSSIFVSSRTVLNSTGSS
jgi:hypothetical protein